MGSKYYVGSIPFGDWDVKHWGVIGMKWGIRKYQNPDGTLTEAGKARYGDVGHYEYRSIGQKLAQRKANKLSQKAESHRQYSEAKRKLAYDNKRKYEDEFKDRARQEFLDASSAHAQSQLEAYKQRDNDRLEYAKRTSWGKAIAQKIILGPMDTSYQRARSRGKGRIQSLFSGPQSKVGVVNVAVSNKRKYGHFMLT